MPTLRIGQHVVGDGKPTYFIADIAANHDGQLDRAVDLIHLAAQAGANAAKFQHFRASKIVSNKGFETMGPQISHQASWRKSVFEVYEAASVSWTWTETLKKACDEEGVDFFSTPYDLEVVDVLDPHVCAFKIGSGDITWIEALEYVAGKGKPVVLATGASDLGEVQRAVDAITQVNRDLILMQCNTNYTGSRENFRYVHLNVLRTYRSMYPDLVIGLSDHTSGHAAVLGAVAFGASAIEKHFTDDCSRPGPDHHFALDPHAWRDMVDRTRELECALGNGNKVVEPNEEGTVIIQRRCLRATRDLEAGTKLARADIEPLRPAPLDAIFPYEIPKIVGRTLRAVLRQGDYLTWAHLA